jgi:hypothetical protein
MPEEQEKVRAAFTGGDNGFSMKCSIHDLFLGGFAILGQANISFAMSVCPSVHKQQFGSHWMDFN